MPSAKTRTLQFQALQGFLLQFQGVSGFALLRSFALVRILLHSFAQKYHAKYHAKYWRNKKRAPGGKAEG